MGQNGNVWEWVESAFDGINDSSSELRAFRGGHWYDTGNDLRSSVRSHGGTPTFSGTDFGFRVASVVPEPSSALLLLGGTALLALRRRRSPAGA